MERGAHFCSQSGFALSSPSWTKMAKTKSAGSTRLGRDSTAQRLGVKLFAGQIAKPGSILVRQRGTKFLAGKNVRRGSDDTLYSITSGIIQFKTIRKKGFDNSQRIAKFVEVIEKPVTKR